TARITTIAQGVIEGNSHYYIMLEGSEAIFDIPVVDFIDIIRSEVGDEVTRDYKAGDQSNTVLSLKAFGTASGRSEQRGATAADQEEGGEDSAVPDGRVEE